MWRGGAPRLLHLPSRFHQLFKSCASETPISQYRARESVSVRIMRLAAHASPLSLSFFLPPPFSLPVSLSRSLFLRPSLSFSFPSCREHVAATVLPERRDPRPDNEIDEAACRSKSNSDASNTPDDRAPSVLFSLFRRWRDISEPVLTRPCLGSIIIACLDETGK